MSKLKLPPEVRKLQAIWRLVRELPEAREFVRDMMRLMREGIPVAGPRLTADMIVTMNPRQRVTLLRLMTDVAVTSAAGAYDRTRALERIGEISGKWARLAAEAGIRAAKEKRGKRG